jgi:uncharacterized protein
MAFADHKLATSGVEDKTAGIVDWDVHNALTRRAVLKGYMSSKWHSYFDQGIVTGPAGLYHVKWARDSIYRSDSVPSNGEAPGSDFELMRDQLLDSFGVSHALLHPITDYFQLPAQGEFGGAAMAALNDWLIAEWLDRDNRLYGAISVTVEDGLRAATEIHRAHTASKRFVKVMLPSVTREPLGHPKYWPIYEAATALGLPIGCHVGGFSGAPTATGAPSYYAEQGTAQPQTAQVQVVSLIGSGVFNHFPDLQFVVEECGIAWMAPLMWRLDRTWRSMREEMPHLERRPSEIIREHFWLTTQPLDEPESPQQLLEMFEDLGMNERILFATDYPHWNFDNPDRVLPASLVGRDLRKMILSTNARALLQTA